MSLKHNTIVRNELDKMFATGIIKQILSAWSFPVVIATKKDGNPRFLWITGHLISE